ncbi:MAG: response regulator [Chloroflexi bacterium]|nr:MAG: response regulator [Chloroflexota bacterium]
MHMSNKLHPFSGKGHDSVKTILVVEDDENIGELIVEAFIQETPYQAMLATDGKQALKIVQNVKPNVLLLDNNLPDMKGIELFDRIQVEKELENVPVLLMSANVPVQEVKKRNLFCLNKPFELNDLLQTIENLLT